MRLLAPARWRVYPRVCGGTHSSRSLRLPSTGLSPRVRGNRCVANANAGVKRSIPACAGEPARSCWRIRRSRVYPRVCGGTCAAGTPATGCRGLSPRVRGNRRDSTGWCGREWSIPACAGEPRPAVSTVAIPAVYPRVCGGTAYIPSFGAAAPGLSPRVRGTPAAEVGAQIFERSIPACAGEPKSIGL